MRDRTFGMMNNRVVELILTTAVVEAIEIIRRQRSTHTLYEKLTQGKIRDVMTSADRHAQESYIGLIMRHFADFDYGIIAEEEIELGGDKQGYEQGNYFTIDPLDGTKAYVRGQTHGIGTMVSLVFGGEVVAAYVGDVNSGDIYGYYPDETVVTHFKPDEDSDILDLRMGQPLDRCFALLRKPSSAYPCPSLIENSLRLFKSYEISGGSIGITMARLWRGEVAAVFLEPNDETPWDSTPVMGISQTLGCAYLRPTAGGGWEEYQPQLTREVYKRDHITLVTPRCYAHHFTGK